MIIRQLKQKQYEQLQKELDTMAQVRLFDASYTVYTTINDITYEIKIQLAKHYKVAVLQAIKVDINDNKISYELITNGNLLSVFLAIFIYQGVSNSKS